jgi:hypothetical protein
MVVDMPESVTLDAGDRVRVLNTEQIVIEAGPGVPKLRVREAWTNFDCVLTITLAEPSA